VAVTIRMVLFYCWGKLFDAGNNTIDHYKMSLLSKINGNHPFGC
jgi:hypothetical protein